MKITFVQPFYHNIWEPLGIAYIISYIQKNYGGALDINFFQGMFDDDKTILEGSKDSDVVAFSCTSPAFKHAVNLSRAIKERNPKTRTVIGGWHSTALKDLCASDCVDQLVVGEGEKAFLDILNGNTDPIVYGEKLGFDQLPYPDRMIIKNYRTVDLCEKINGHRIASFQANRVCPVSCAFCAEKTMTGRFNRATNPIRQRDAKDVCDEIEIVIDHLNLTYFKFVDATFDTSPQYVIDFCKEKINRGINTEWEALIHCSFTNEEMMYWLKQSNCNQINMGVESGSDKILKDIGKGLTTARVKNAFAWAKKHNINRRGFFILGMPNETIEDLELTDKLIQDIDADVVGFTILCPYPGCAIYDHEKYKDIDWSMTDEYSNDFWSTQHFTNQELKEWQSYFTNKYQKLLCERQQIQYPGEQ